MVRNSVFKVLILMSMIMSSFCYFYIIPAELGKSKDHDGFCFFNDTSALIKKGENIITTRCEEVSCNDDYSMSVAGCGTFSLNDPSCLRWERDFTKPYPKCCTTFICVEFANKVVDSDAINTNILD